MVIGAAALVVTAASAGPSAIATSGTATAPVVAGRAVGVTSFATAASGAQASRTDTRTPIASPLNSPTALSGAAAHVVPLAPFTESAAGGAIARAALTDATRAALPSAITQSNAAGTAAGRAAADHSGQVAKPATSAVSVRSATPATRAVALWVRPNGGPLSSPFGRRWGRMHEGIDLAGSYGSPIVAATAGTVYFTGPEQGYGRIIKIQDSDGTQTWYAHMSRYLVRPGAHVKAGQRIAVVGATGDATGPNLHFEVHVGGRPVDPIPFLRKHGVRI
jgi:murein DD-endopeptidase MepM/ murein hydrolase activator NlpD